MLRILIALFCASLLRAADRYVTRTGAGAANGTNWSNAYAALPATLVRGDVYYIAGDSTTYSRYTLDTTSGSGIVTIRKATAVNAGAVTGWQSSYGTERATFTAAATGLGPLYIAVSDVVIDGVSKTGIDSGHGFKFVSPNVTTFTNGITVATGNSGITVKFSEVQMSPTSVESNSCVYLVASTSNGITGVTFEDSYLHHSTQDIFTITRASGVTLRRCMLECNQTNGVTHGQGISFDALQNLTVDRSVFKDIMSTGMIYGGLTLNAASDDFVITNNLFYRSTNVPGALSTHTGSNNASVLTDSTRSGGLAWASNVLIGSKVFNTTDGSSGIISGNTSNTITATLSGGSENDWDTGDGWSVFVFPSGIKNGAVGDYGTRSNWLVANNTFYNLGADVGGARGIVEFSTGGTNNRAYNNLIYNCGGGAQVLMVNVTNDYNAYYSIVTFPIETHGVTGIGNPFVNAPSDFHPAGGAQTINAGTDLSGTFTVDFDGNVRASWDIGAYEYQTGQTPGTVGTFTVGGSNP